jgi:hypothetical protein
MREKKRNYKNSSLVPDWKYVLIYVYTDNEHFNFKYSVW